MEDAKKMREELREKVVEAVRGNCREFRARLGGGGGREVEGGVEGAGARVRRTEKAVVGCCWSHKC